MSERWVPIPSQFHSLYHEGPFRNCVDCNRDLIADNCTYGIERVFRGTEPVMEMAICMDCRNKISEDLSKESSQRISAFLEERFDFEMRFEDTKNWGGDEIEKWLDRCILLKTPKEECRNYQIAAICRGGLMSIDLLPIMISEDASREMQKLMSKKTRDRLGDMVDEFFGQPSEFADGPENFSPMIW